MRKLIAKVMSDEDIPDGDKRKCFDLHVIPENYSISFTRQDDGIAAMCLNPDSNKLPSLVIGLPGNVYIMEDGNTISTFIVKPVEVKSVQGIVTNRDGSMVFHNDEYECEMTPDGMVVRSKHDTHFTRLVGNEPNGPAIMVPMSTRPHQDPTQRPRLSSGVALSSAIPAPPVDETRLALNNSLGDLLTLATSDIEMPAAVKKDWNELINHRLTSESKTPIVLAATMVGVEVSDIIEKYVIGVSNALLNHKPQLCVMAYKKSPTSDGYMLSIDSPRDQFGVTTEVLNRAKSNLDINLSGLVVAAYERIVKLWRYGATEVYFNVPFSITTKELSKLNAVFNKYFDIAVEFDGKNDRVDMAVITRTR